MEKALKSVREAHQAELDNERYYQHQNYLAMHEQIKSLEEKNKKLSSENESMKLAVDHSHNIQAKLNVAQRKLNQMTLVEQYLQVRYNKQLNDIQNESKTRLGTLQEQIKSLEEKIKKLSIDWVTEHIALTLENMLANM